MPTRILLADDHRIMREGLRALLSGQPGISVVAEAENGRKAVQMARELTPDLVIMDVSMPDLNGIEATRQIAADNPDIRIIALSIHQDRRFVLQMFRAGASGYLLKDCAFEELTRAIRAVSDGQAYLSPGIAGVVVGEFLRNLVAEGAQNAPSLTAREREVLQLMAEGKTTKEIASRLSISVKTVETHRRLIMEKLHLNSVAELTKYAIREGLTTL
jgi:two-component system, NarL family, response regulator NreC